MGRAIFSIDESGVVLEKPVVRAKGAARGTSPPVRESKTPSAAKLPPPTRAHAERAARTAPVGGGTSASPRGGLRTALPWLLLFSILGGAAGLALWGWQKYGMLADRTGRADEEARALGDKAARLEGEVLALGAELKRTQGDVTAGKVSSAATQRVFDDLEKRLTRVVTPAKGEIKRERERLTLALSDDLLFRAGEAKLTDAGRIALLDLGEALNQFPEQQVWIKATTDEVAVAQAPVGKFDSDWQLSAARAAAVVDYLQADALIDPRRLAAVALGERRPRSGKRLAHRRVELVVTPMAATPRDR